MHFEQKRPALRPLVTTTKNICHVTQFSSGYPNRMERKPRVNNKKKFFVLRMTQIRRKRRQGDDVGAEISESSPTPDASESLSKAVVLEKPLRGFFLLQQILGGNCFQDILFARFLDVAA